MRLKYRSAENRNREGGGIAQSAAAHRVLAIVFISFLLEIVYL
jgi:hypothetical protein